MENRKSVMISSTIIDLPEHRKDVMDACLRVGTFPVMMEHLPASDDDAIRMSLKLVNEADIYLGIFAHRYGYVPKLKNPKEISVTQMEYERARERNIPRLIFMMDDDHPIKIENVDKGEVSDKLETFKKQLLTENIVIFFRSPADLRAHVINSLFKYREVDALQFHYISNIPTPPEKYIAHPYTLLQSHQLIGREEQLNKLTDWVTKKDEKIYTNSILNIVAIGGMGKSALTWKWFNEIAPHEMAPLAGRMWWSFYESDASFENFIIRALAYVTKYPLDEIKKISPLEREEQLFYCLDREPFLFVLDGLERILRAYARTDAARLSDDDIDQQTSNYLIDSDSASMDAKSGPFVRHNLRKTTDPRAGAFLQKLANIHSARILISTRLFPADLQTAAGDRVKGCEVILLHGLEDNDALNLWRAFNASGARDTLIPIFQKIDFHPLLIQSLASEVGNYRAAPGDFDKWQKDHPRFNLFHLPMMNPKTHILDFALNGLRHQVKKALVTLAAFRMPANYNTLVALFVGENRFFAGENKLDVALKELEDRGLVGWDRRANRYDLHPIVRGVVWDRLSDKIRNSVLAALQAYFDSVPKVDIEKVNTIDDLIATIELYNILIGLKRYDDAVQLLYDHLNTILHYRLSANRQRAELLELLFPDGTDQLPRLNSPYKQAFTLNALSTALMTSGRPGRAIPILRRHSNLREKDIHTHNLCVGLNNLSSTLRVMGALYESEKVASSALIKTREQKDYVEEATSLNWLGLNWATRGLAEESYFALQRALTIDFRVASRQAQTADISFLAQRELWFHDYNRVLELTEIALEFAYTTRFERDIIRLNRIRGIAFYKLRNFDEAEKLLHEALIRARAIDHIEEEISAFIALAELWRHQKPNIARDYLDNVWEYTELGPYPLLQTDALNVLAEIERSAKYKEKAIEAAIRAYQLAWCDGEPYSYYWGLETARLQLREFKVKEPSQSPFDKSLYKPIIEINQDDEFYISSPEVNSKQLNKVVGSVREPHPSKNFQKWLNKIRKSK